MKIKISTLFEFLHSPASKKKCLCTYSKPIGEGELCKHCSKCPSSNSFALLQRRSHFEKDDWKTSENHWSQPCIWSFMFIDWQLVDTHSSHKTRHKLWSLEPYVFGHTAVNAIHYHTQNFQIQVTQFILGSVDLNFGPQLKMSPWEFRGSISVHGGPNSF